MRRRTQGKARVGRVPWSAEYDAVLAELVAELGVGRWPEVALRRKPKRGRGPVCSASARAGRRW